MKNTGEGILRQPQPSTGYCARQYKIELGRLPGEHAYPRSSIRRSKFGKVFEMGMHNLRVPEGHEYFTFNDELYMRKSGLAQDAMPALTFDAADWGARCTRKALRSLGMTTDELENGVQMPDAEDEEYETTLNAHGEKTFGKDAWDKFRKSYRRKTAKDSPREGGGEPVIRRGGIIVQQPASRRVFGLIGCANLLAVVEHRRATVPGTAKLAETKLGNYARMTLDEARRERDRRAEAAEAAHANGHGPTPAKPDKGKTLRVVAEEYFANRIGHGKWKSLTYPKQVRRRLERHVYPLIGHIPVAHLNHEHIRQVFDRPGKDGRSFWSRHPTVAEPIRQMLAAILDYAAAPTIGYRSPDLANPADWSRLQHVYPAVDDIHQTKHHASVLAEDAPALMAAIRSDRPKKKKLPIAARALECILLCAVRVSDVFGGGREHSEPLKWKHLDLHNRNWHVPITKKDKPLVVPLSKQAFDIIMEMRALQGGKPDPEAKVFDRTVTTVRKVLVRIGVVEQQSVHGCRALFYTHFKNHDDDVDPLKPDLINAAMTHAPRDLMDTHYNRGSYLEKRRAMMQRWANFLDGDQDGNKDDVTNLKPSEAPEKRGNMEIVTTISAPPALREVV